MPSTTNGVIWSAIERFSVQGVSFLLGIVIARLVTPGEYGLIAMLAIFMAIAQSFIDSGFGNALIQKTDRNEVDYSTVFYFNIVISAILYGILYLCAPLIARFYNQPELTSVTRWIGLNLIFISFSVVQRTRLNIDLNFKLQAKVSLAAVIISGIAGITMAYHGWGVWALVFQSLSNNLLSTIFLWASAKWHPMLLFSIDSFKRLFSFGSKLLASGLLHTIYLNLYSLVIGKFYNAEDVGFYNRAYTISQYPSTNIVMIVTRAIYPVQCAHQDDDKWLEQHFLGYLRMTCFIVFPLMTLLAVIAKPLVLLVLTEKWLSAAELISILSLAYMWYPVMVINNQMLNVKGRSDLFFKLEIIKKIFAVIILFATLPFGVVWLCWGVVAYNLFDMLLTIAFTKKVIPTTYISQFHSLKLILLNVTFSSVISYVCLISIQHVWLQVITGIIIYISLYFLICRVLKLKELVFILDFMHHRLA